MTAIRLPFFVLIVATLFLSACQTAPVMPTNVAQQRQLIQRVPSWRAEGKISVTMNNERHSASFDWQQRHKNYVIHLFGPFGQGSTWLRRTSKAVTLENSETGIRRATNAEQLMEETLGWHVPVSELQYWIRGLAAPTPAPTAEKVGEQGLIQELEQQGWKVNYIRYEPHEGWLLPTKLRAERDSIEVTIVIKQWQLALAPTFVP